MSKRIFAQKKEPLSVTENGRTPSCYYHKQPITHFCVKKKCTLPLCDECLPIHKKEHINNKQIAMEGIEQFEKARGEALDAFENRRKEVQEVQQKFRKKVEAYKLDIVAVIDKLLSSFSQECLVTDGNLQILQEIEERTSQIRAGSLKELIRYYEDIFGAQHYRKLYKMYYGDYLTHFKLELSKESVAKLEQILKGGLINTALTESQPKNQPTSPSILEAEQFQIGSPGVVPSHTPQSYTPVVIHRPEKMSVREKENDEESEISTYKLLKTKVKKEEHASNIYTDTRAVRDNPSGLTSKQNSQTSKSKSRRKKGLSLAKSHQQLPLQTRQSFNKSESSQQPSLQSHQCDRRSNWRQFINMGAVRMGEGVGVKTNVLEGEGPLGQVLNPREMRQLILKKKEASRSQNGKELKSYRSSVITPVSSLEE